MAILKVGRQVSLSSSPFNRSFHMEDTGDELNDSEFREAGYEHSMFQIQSLNIPYELYDLPDLRDILSVETWNSFLTEEERFTLSTYLPDMDQQTFWSTMKDLLGGNDMFFNSPLTMFFNNLKGGYYNEKVIRYRENLELLRGIACCHSLRLYHDNMVRTFLEMKRVWDPCTQRNSVKERLCIWKAWKNPNDGVNTLDLNAFPEDEGMSGEEVGILALSKKTNSMDTLPFSMPIEMKLSPFNTSKKGVPKIKPNGLNTPFPAAKGVLKMVPKAPASQDEQPKALPLQTKVKPLLPVSKTSRFSTLPSQVHKQDARDYGALLRCDEIGIDAYRSPYPSDCIMNQRRMECIYDAAMPEVNFGYFTRNSEETQASSDLITGLPGHKNSPGVVKMRSPDGKQAAPCRVISGGVLRQLESNIRERITGGAQKSSKTYKRRKVPTTR